MLDVLKEILLDNQEAEFFTQASLRPRERFWDIPVAKIDSAFDSQ